MEIKIIDNKDGYEYVYASCEFSDNDLRGQDNYINHYKRLGYTIQVKTKRYDYTVQMKSKKV